MTLADEDANSILTDNANRAFRGNVAMQVVQPGGQLWNQAMQVMSPDDQNLNQLETNQKSIFPLTQQIIDILMIYAVLS